MTNMTISTSQASMVPTPMTPHIQNMSGSMGPHVSSFTQNPSPQSCYPPEYYQSCQNTVPMMSMPRMMSYGKCLYSLCKVKYVKFMFCFLRPLVLAIEAL